MKKGRITEILILLTIAIIGFAAIHGIYYQAVVKPNLYTIRFHDVDSLIKGSPVRFMGILVGHVRNMKRSDGIILCEIVITKPHTKIPDGAVAKVEYNGLGGSKSIEIMPPDTDNPEVKGIVAVNALRISDFMEVFRELHSVLICIKQFVEGIDPKAAEGALKTVAEAPDFTIEANKSLDNMMEEQRKTSLKLRKLKGFGLQVEQIIDKIRFH